MTDTRPAPRVEVLPPMQPTLGLTPRSRREHPRCAASVAALAACCGLCLSSSAFALLQPSTPPAPPVSPGSEPATPAATSPATPAKTPPSNPSPSDPGSKPDGMPSSPSADGAASSQASSATDPKAESKGDAKPDSKADAKSDSKVDSKADTKADYKLDTLNRRIMPGEPTKLSFKQINVEQLIPFIVESTGKVVLPQQEVLARRITLLNDKPIPRSQALDLVFLALQQTGVAVIESADMILLRDQVDVDRQSVPVLPSDQSTLDRSDLGTVVQKVFAIRSGSAATLGEVIKPSIPDYAKLAVEPESNQILITGPIALLQRIERVLNALDKPAAAALATKTFRLKFSDADQVAQNIRDLYANAQGQQGGNQNRNQQVQQFIRQFQGGGNQGQGGQGGRGGQGNQNNANQAASTSNNLRVTSNAQQNSVTVLAEQSVIDQIDRQIEFWDKRVDEQESVPKVYNLKYSDPVKVRDILEKLYGTPTATGQQGGGAARTTATGGSRLAGQFSFQAIPEAGRLIVVSKSPANLTAIDQAIAEIDKPITSIIPEVIELKHASAEDLAEQINALLAQEGTLAQTRRTDTELRTSATNSSPFASSSSTSSQTTQANQANQNATTNQQYWWARARVPTDTAGSGNLVSKARIVPVSRQNALMVLAPLEYRAAVIELIDRLDRPGRQVLVAAVIAEVTLDDATALGIRFSQTGITPTRSDNTFSAGATRTNGQTGQVFAGTKNDLLPGLFNSSVLNVGVDVNVLLQALSQDSKVTVLSEPRIFTGDNQQAEFFDGQDIPFITNSQVPTGANTNVVNSFDYRAVGIALRVRPRITPERDVDLKVNLELSSISTSQTVNNQAVVDRRETTTQLIVRDGQTVVISGILRTQDSDVKRKVPGLGDIPLVGGLFQSMEKSKTRTELVAFITPLVVNNPEDFRRVNDPAVKRLDEMREELMNKDGKPGTGKKKDDKPILDDRPLSRDD